MNFTRGAFLMIIVAEEDEEEIIEADEWAFGEMEEITVIHFSLLSWRIFVNWSISF